jgi:hypothetical protein
VRPSGGVSVLHKIFDDGFIRNKGLVRFGLPVADFLGCNFNSLRIAKRFIAQLKKNFSVYSIVPDRIGAASSGKNSALY